MASSEDLAVVKDFVVEVPLRWGDMDATPQAFPELRSAPWRLAGSLQS